MMQADKQPAWLAKGEVVERARSERLMMQVDKQPLGLAKASSWARTARVIDDAGRKTAGLAREGRVRWASDQLKALVFKTFTHDSTGLQELDWSLKVKLVYTTACRLRLSSSIRQTIADRKQDRGVRARALRSGRAFVHGAVLLSTPTKRRALSRCSCSLR
ncbi:hypothetical protein THAOC_15426 [Thalassiosira oceanica]|uniref:Uncharacterized protein n=1 Tax=Thalassiosira oceanica TaxID=159749 RepID=K0SFU4_THAOC|nr:hypothetical protein THAOC_15426 [Thalassiosira oceanica]|eukprot:EJK63889.1 hypothetical protein THAOC_15426 [Thalassiosira oceanica]